MRGFALVGDAFKGCFQNWRLWLIQFLINPLLFVLFAGWLLLPVANTGHLILNVLLAVVLVCGALLLHAGTLNYFYLQDRNENAQLKEVFGRALRHLFAVAVCVLVIYLLWSLVTRADRYAETLPAYLRSNLPEFVRRHAGEPFFNSLFAGILFALRWILVPGLILPFIASASCFGFRGLGWKGIKTWKKTVFSLAYWGIVILAALLGVLATEKLMGWTPDFRTSTFAGEKASLAVRLFASYLLGLFAWMLACSVVGRGGRELEVPESVGGQAVA
jgi:hypothetical protein